MLYFVAMWALLVIGWVVHSLFLDRHRAARTGPRLIELALVWLLVVGGAWAIIGGLGHIGPNSTEVAEQIGYEQSMFQWEVGWGDIAIGVLGVACALPRFRGMWMTAAVVALALSYGGDAIGHLMQLIEHDNRQPGNVWALPSDILQPLLAVGLLVAYRRTHRSSRELASSIHGDQRRGA